MPECLFVAAGGGGDVIAAAILASALHIDPSEAVIATWAWDRLLIDPVPGPRRPWEFEGLGTYGGMRCEVLETTLPPTGGGSTLPRLRSELGHRLLIIDPSHGVRGITDQVTLISNSLSGAQHIYLVDVGGDVLARGDEPGLRSPLADAMMLAACARFEADLLLAGPGLDGELTSAEALQRIRDTGGVPMLTLGEPHVDAFLSILDWHPSEATALLVAAARGLRGVAEIRAAGLRVPLTDGSPVVWSMPTQTAVSACLASRVTDSASLDQAESHLKRVLGRTELDDERRKASREAKQRPSPARLNSDDLRQLRALERDARLRGVDFLTFRRIAEGLGISGHISTLRSNLIASRAQQLTPPLWSLRAEPSRVTAAL